MSDENLLSDEPECNLVDLELSYIDEEDQDLSYILDGHMDPKENHSYILGTLIVRVAGARDLKVRDFIAQSTLVKLITF